MFCQVLLLVWVASCADCSINPYPKPPVTYQPQELRGTDPPLVLTDYIEANRAGKARALAQVKLPGFNLTSYSGFLRVNTTTDKALNASMFFWFFPAEVNASSAPLLVWLNGGPGVSSMYGLFEEHGPLLLSTVNGTLKLQKRKTHWTLNHNVIYIDNPVGAGFSYAQHPDLYARNESQVGSNLYTALTQFFKLFPEYRKNDFYVTGESYAGKFVPALAYTIHVNNPAAKHKINLKGISIGNGLCDPVNMMVYGQYLYQIGLIDDSGKAFFERKEKEAVQLIGKGKMEAANDVFDTLLNGKQNETGSFKNLTGLTNFFNFLVPLDVSPYGRMWDLFQNETFKKSIHVGGVAFNLDPPVEKFLKEDIMASVKSWIEILVNSTEPKSNTKKYKVLFYSGQVDVLVPYPLTVNFLKSLNWSGKADYLKAVRRVWYHEDDIAGYVKKVDNLYEVLVRNAGHIVPADQPEWAFDLITQFTRGKL